MRYVIIGGDAAGMSAAMQLVRKDNQADITVLEKGEHYSYAQCGLPYWIGGEIDSEEKLVARTADTYRTKYGIDARTNHEVTSVDVSKKIVYGDQFEVPYDKLLVASGARPFIPDWKNPDLKGIYTLKTIPDAKRILSEITGQKRNITIIGGGSIGLEIAENVCKDGHQVRILERSARLAMNFDKEMTDHIHEKAIEKGVQLDLNHDIIGFNGDDNGNVTSIETNLSVCETDLVIVAVGVRPNTQFLEGTGIHFDQNGAVRVNRYMETNIDCIYAAGDCATQYNRMIQKDTYAPLGTHANKQGRIAGLNMSGNPRAFKGIVGTQIYKFFELTLARTGLSSREIEEMGFPYKCVQAKLPHVAAYYPTHEPLVIRLQYHAESGAVLGGQFIGTKGVDKRCDVLATALYHGMTMLELEDLDLGYSPPFNSVWDPLQQTARRRS
ncbi:pyridine nucleotide-disulfide oxidoreductase [Bacillus sp. JCM 19046]|uniref:NADPH-dependent 2,4-dienoyl-CoA reductase/sulfur reductase-like enzyme n=1 Tax=Shouchella xiaoxiensis TaxID=766895 RepID=A0ABS2SYM0_9BACI|nr:FAD-dependent oxidoreductase [Shouchella xiaoxiensis]MBM7840632.1 NADPH-dependent 2,4-dienoyl-CoA reductase/sulfur reductase-like enzyme [Shouchella xiaoxiensis]GAF12782.1 pyridine nucleotide-disulfide oxidoreductase [Bacillus sp. JCM 19045]GAF16820.1 pyridine nucleotide-disulfide oxidoreductase [Bacillus sp. JCM 19046]